METQRSGILDLVRNPRLGPAGPKCQKWSGIGHKVWVQIFRDAPGMTKEQRWIFLLIPVPEVPGLFSFSRAVIFKSGVSCRNIGQEQLRVTQTWKCRQNIEICYIVQTWKWRQNIEICYIVQIWRVSYSIVHRNNIFFGVRADILLLCAEKLPFLGFVQKYYCPLRSRYQGGTWIPVHGHFWVCEEILVFRRNIHLCIGSPRPLKGTQMGTVLYEFLKYVPRI